jgi:predicted nucleic acid-binding protein
MVARPLVLDSWPVLAVFDDEPAAARSEIEIKEALGAARRTVISVVNAGEIWYALLRKRSRADAERAIELLSKMGIELVPVDWAIARQAAEYKARGGISYADCFAAATARRIDGQVLTGDREFEVVEDGVDIIWV